ncbi:proton channel OtopLc-like [Onthophagus taurus]|uniref:proton channel OtopLc-like n=1 Tax=Onthophagus taurus TaxID=166361 RepID=UPI0039BE5B9B
MPQKNLSHSVSYDPNGVLRRPASQNNLDPMKHRHLSTISQPSLHHSASGPILKRMNSSNSIISQGISAKPRVQQGKNGVVLQLVIPNTNMYSQDPEPIEGTMLRKRPISTIGNGTPQASFFCDTPPYGDYVNGSLKGAETVISEAQSILPTSHEEKQRITREILTIQYSLIYAITLVVLGTTTFIVDIIFDIEPMTVILSYYIVCVSFIFMLYIMIDVRVYMNRKRKFNDTLERNHSGNVEFSENADGGIQMSIPLPPAAKLQKPLEHFYCLTTGRHGGSLYLKIGAAVFCLGHLIHAALILGYQIIYLTSDDDMFYKCSTIERLVLDFIYPAYSFTLLFFIFKYSNVIINRNIPLARMGFMHCIGSSLCLWIHTIIRETFDYLAFYEGWNPRDERQLETHGRYGKYGVPKENASNLTQNDNRFNIQVRIFTGVCEADEGMAIIYQNFSPYLYPFSVEFNILVVGILYIVWDSIATCKQSFEHNDEAAAIARDCDSNFGEDAPVQESNLTIHTDCHSSNKGIFAGIILLIVTIVAIILFFVAINDERFQETGLTVSLATDVVILLVMLGATIWLYFYVVKLDRNHHHISMLDDVLLYICIPMFLLNLIFGMVPAVYYGNGLSIAHLFIMMIQVIIQTTLIVDGIRRCSNCRETRKTKPGRELVTFLIIANVAMWIMHTFQVTSHDLHDDRYAFYGKVLWTILGHVWLPLMMFYRFHASAGLVDMWKYGYEKASH